MPQASPAFEPDLLITMREALDLAADRVPVMSRTPATKAKMAQRILASEGRDDLDDLELSFQLQPQARPPVAREPAARRGLGLPIRFD